MPKPSTPPCGNGASRSGSCFGGRVFRPCSISRIRTGTDSRSSRAAPERSRTRAATSCGPFLSGQGVFDLALVSARDVGYVVRVVAPDEDQAAFLHHPEVGLLHRRIRRTLGA